MALWKITPPGAEPFIFDDGPARFASTGKEGMTQRFVKQYLRESGMDGLRYRYAGKSKEAEPPKGDVRIASLEARLAKLEAAQG